MPSPYGAGATTVVPWIKTPVAFELSPVVGSTTVSDGVVAPLATSTAPRVPAEFSQPWPVAPLFAQGQGAVTPSPVHEIVPSSGWHTERCVRNPSMPASQ